MIQLSTTNYTIPELTEEHKRNLWELFITQDARSALYLDRILILYTYECLKQTYNLTDTETKVAYYTCHDHLMYQEIADRMGISYGELCDHHKSILTKTNMKNMVKVDMTVIRITYIITSYIQNILIRLITNKHNTPLR